MKTKKYKRDKMRERNRPRKEKKRNYVGNKRIVRRRRNTLMKKESMVENNLVKGVKRLRKENERPFSPDVSVRKKYEKQNVTVRAGSRK